MMINTDDILHFIIYIIIYAFAGWVLESVSKTIEQKKPVNSGFLYGPFCPIYGFGAIIMIICLGFLKNNIILLFLASFFLLSIWEYIVGVFLEKIFKTTYWDYSNLKFNINGRVCLKNSIYWGILGVAFIKIIHPFIEKYILMIPNNMLVYIDVALGFAILVDAIISAIQIINIDTAITKLNELGESIKDKALELGKLKDKAKNKTEEFEKSKIESVEKLIKELKITQAKLKIKIYKQAYRLKKAFPDMKSEAITKFLSQKLDINNLKENLKRKKKE